MRIPELVLCDFCKGAIDRSAPWPALAYPLSDAQREALAPTLLPPRFSMLGLSPIECVPRSITLEVCRGCIDGLLPMVGEIAAERVREVLAIKAKAATTIDASE